MLWGVLKTACFKSIIFILLRKAGIYGGEWFSSV